MSVFLIFGFPLYRFSRNKKTAKRAKVIIKTISYLPIEDLKDFETQVETAKRMRFKIDAKIKY